MQIERLNVCAALLLLAAPGLAQPVDFNALRTYPIYPGTGPIAVADFNGDGKPDLAVSSGQLTAILLGNGDGTFLPVANSSAPGGTSMVVGDFNGDGKLDLAVTLYPINGVAIALGNGDGTFQASKIVYNSGNTATFWPPETATAMGNLLRTPPIKPCVTRSFAFGVSANDLPNWRNDAVSRHPRQHPALAESQLRDLRDWVDSHTTSLPKYAQRNRA